MTSRSIPRAFAAQVPSPGGCNTDDKLACKRALHARGIGRIPPAASFVAPLQRLAGARGAGVDGSPAARCGAEARRQGTRAGPSERPVKFTTPNRQRARPGKGGLSFDHVNVRLQGYANPTRRSCHAANPPSWAELPVVILERLAREGVHAQEWRGLGYRRREIWGLTRAHVVLIDSCSRVRT